MEWKTETGKAMAIYSETRWWSRWEVYYQVIVQFGNVTPFLEKHDEIALTTRRKLLELLHDGSFPKDGVCRLWTQESLL